MADTRRLQFIIDAQNKANTAFRQVSDDLSDVSKKFDIARDASVKVAAAIAVVGGAAIAAAGYAVKMASEFEDGMANVATLVDGAIENMDDMKNAVLEVSKKTPVALSDLTGALYQIRSAGIEAKGAMDTLEASVKLATAGLGTTPEAVDLVTSAINAFGIESTKATEVANAMFLAVKNGKTTVSELAQGFGQIAPLANQMGMSMEDLISITSSMTTSGMSASIAYSQLRGTLSNLLKPTKAMASVYNELGLSVSSVNELIAQQGLSETLRMLADHVNNDTAVLGQMFGSVEGLNAVLMLLNTTGENADSIMNDMFESATALDEAYKKKTDTVKAQWQLLKNNLNVVLIELGSKILPIVNKSVRLLTDKFSETIPKIKELANWLKEHKGLLLIIAGAITGTLIPALIGLAINIWTTVLPAIMAATLALAPYAIGGAIIGGIVAGILWIIKHWDKLKNSAVSIFGSISGYIVDKWNNIKEKISTTLRAIKDELSAAWEAISSVVYDVWTRIKDFIEQVWIAIKTIIKFYISFIAGIILSILEAMGIDIVKVFTDVKDWLTSIWASIGSAAKYVFNDMKEFFARTWTDIKNFLVSTWESINQFFEWMAQGLINIWNSMWDSIAAFVDPIWAGIKEKVSNGWNAITSKFSQATKPIRDAWNNLWDGIAQALANTWEGIKNQIKSGINWIIDKVNSLIRTINSVTQKGASVLGLTAPQIPTIPMLANGGIVTRPTLAMVGEAGPEAVVPLNRSGALAGAGFGNITINISGNEFMGEEGIADRIGDQIMRSLKNTLKI